MRLMMYIGNDLIESVPLELGRISKPGYLGSFKRALKVKHNDLILQHGEKPEFLVAEPITETKSPIDKRMKRIEPSGDQSLNAFGEIKP